MRREILWALMLAIALIAVLFAQRQLREELGKTQSPEMDLPFEGDRISEGESGDGAGNGAEDGVGEGEVDRGELMEGRSPPLEIQARLATALQSFHQKQAIAQASSEQLHDTPKVIHDAAEELAKVAEIETQNPQYAEAFREFYLRCARDAESLTVIRAQCLEKYIQRAALSEDAKAQLLTELPESVVRLYRAL